MSQPTPLGASWRGLAAGAIGTAAMDLLQFYRYRRGGGQTGFVEQEFTPGLSSFEEAPAPAKIGKRVVEGVFQHEVPDRRAALVNNVMHWSYGIGWGMPYAIVVGSIGSLPTVRSGAAFGSIVWASDYVLLPLAKLYEPIWKYDAKTLADDLTSHVAYGVATAIAFRLLSPD